MPRSIWSGSISFGLVNVPVRLYSAVQEHKLRFHFVHEKDSSPIGYEKICKKEGKPVADDEIVKAFEFEKGEYVFMDDEDFEAAKVEGYKAIDIVDFVPYEDIDPIYFAHTYYVGPDRGAEKTYSLLVKAMEGSELAGIAKFVMRDRQNLGALRVRDGVITLEQLRYADEIRDVAEIKASRTRVSSEELKMAERLIESFTTQWKPEKYKDTYRDELCAIIRAKRKGKEVHAAPEVEEEAPTDLLTALRESVERSRGTTKARKRRPSTKRSSSSTRKRRAA
ncbi:MAG: Ku protein [Actinobacteria bacterium 13_1_20CM_4_69_9]|jgi:DNA end-binding protein Ku|nr:MAG: Ku protein [Actinobacteria bacterium 13_1_20CM_4_69_9]